MIQGCVLSEYLQLDSEVTVYKVKKATRSSSGEVYIDGAVPSTLELLHLYSGKQETCRRPQGSGGQQRKQKHTLMYMLWGGHTYVHGCKRCLKPTSPRSQGTLTLLSLLFLLLVLLGWIGEILHLLVCCVLYLL